MQVLIIYIGDTLDLNKVKAYYIVRTGVDRCCEIRAVKQLLVKVLILYFTITLW